MNHNQEGLSKSSGLGRFLEPDPLQLTADQIRASLSADFFDQ
jgi:hypothetical protein